MRLVVRVCCVSVVCVAFLECHFILPCSHATVCVNFLVMGRLIASISVGRSRLASLVLWLSFEIPSQIGLANCPPGLRAACSAQPPVLSEEVLPPLTACPRTSSSSPSMSVPIAADVVLCFRDPLRCRVGGGGVDSACLLRKAARALPM